MIIDFHTHLGKNWGKSSYAISEERHSEEIRKNHIDKAVVFAEPVPDYRFHTSKLVSPLFIPSNANDRIGKYAETDERIIPFCYVDHRHPNASDEIERCVKLYNVKGVKLHPGTNVTLEKKLMKFDIPFEIVGTASEYGLCVITHPPEYELDNLKNAIEQNPEVPFIIAHLGLMKRKLQSFAKNFENAYLDTSASTSDNLTGYFESLCDVYNGLFGTSIDLSSPQKNIESTIQTVGSKNVIFGSDIPWSNLSREIGTVKKAGAGDEIFYQNALRILM